MTRFLIPAAIALLAATTIPAAKAAPIDLSTGQAGWELTPPGGTVASAINIAPNPNWTSIAGADWIGSTAGTNPAPTGVYTYTLDFTLVRGGKDLDIAWTSDNGGTLSLTGDYDDTEGTVSTQGDRGTFDDVFTATFTGLSAGSFALTAEIENLCKTTDTTDCTGENNPTGFIANATAVPLPGAFWLLLGALGGLAGIHRVAVRRAV